MSVMKKMVTLLRSSAREIGDSVVAANATQIAEQEVRDAQQHIDDAKRELTTVMAQEMHVTREQQRLMGEIARYEDQAVQALNQGQEELALAVAQRVARLEEELAQQSQILAAQAAQVLQLKDLIRAAEARVREHERELAMARTTESVYRATQSISESTLGQASKMASARESLERIKAKHSLLADRMAAAQKLEQELTQPALDRELTAAGIGPAAEHQREVMARIRRRQGSS